MIQTRLDVDQVELKRALSAPENAVHRERSPCTGRRGLYKTALVWCSWSCRARPHLGRAVVRSVQSQTESHSVALTWQPAPSAASGYNVYRSTAASGPYAKVNSPDVAATAFTDSSVQGGQVYYYVVMAVDSAGSESSPSAQVSAAIPTP